MFWPSRHPPRYDETNFFKFWEVHFFRWANRIFGKCGSWKILRNRAKRGRVDHLVDYHVPSVDPKYHWSCCCWNLTPRSRTQIPISTLFKLENLNVNQPSLRALLSSMFSFPRHQERIVHAANRQRWMEMLVNNENFNYPPSKLSLLITAAIW